MAAKRARSAGTRVTNVNPWILGGEGRLVDLFPLNPWLILFGRFILSLFRHPIRTFVLIITFYCLYKYGLPALLTPFLLYILIASLHIAKHWWYSPDVPLIRFKQRNSD